MRMPMPAHMGNSVPALTSGYSIPAARHRSSSRRIRRPCRPGSVSADREMASPACRPRFSTSHLRPLRPPRSPKRPIITRHVGRRQVAGAASPSPAPRLFVGSWVPVSNMTPRVHAASPERRHMPVSRGTRRRLSAGKRTRTAMSRRPGISRRRTRASTTARQKLVRRRASCWLITALAISRAA